VNNQKLIKLSRFLSYVLRHKPDEIDLTIDPQGWVSVEELLQKAQQAGKPITRELLETIVENDDKQRYSFNADGSMIRANQGHSVEIDLNLTPIEPPEFLFHGTAVRNVSSIREHGLLKQKRHHVHLSENEETAKRVGARYGKPVILTISAKAMAEAGHTFYRSENHVWLTDSVPAEFIAFPNS
jgi:putative RNA 2'-phosphotransferase